MSPTRIASPLAHKNGYRLQFSFRGKQYRRFLIKDKKLAKIFQGRINNLLMEFKYGLISIPDNTSLADFIFSTVVDKPEEEVNNYVTVIYLSQLVDEYEKTLLSSDKAESTQKTEQIHLRHLRKYIKRSQTDPILEQIYPRFFIDYKVHRKESKVLSDTINKELRTFQSMFSFAGQSGYVQHNVVREVKRDKSESISQFRSTEEMEEKLKSKNLSEKEKKAIRRCRYFNPDEIRKIILLAKNDWLQPILITFCYTGARRVEITRLTWDDIDFSREIVKVKSGKQSSKRKITVRSVNMTPELKVTLLKQKEKIKNCDWVFPGQNGKQLSVNTLRSALSRVTKGSEFEGIGFHSFRYSFASNLASAGMDERVIGYTMGHTTQEMREHYQFIFPGKGRDIAQKLHQLYKKE